MCEMTQPYALDDPTVDGLAKFLENTPLSNGGFAPIPPGISTYLAQAVCNFAQGLVYDHDRRDWIDLNLWSRQPDLGDVDVRLIGDKPDQVVRMTHRTSGISVLAEDPDEAWKKLKEKVASHAG